MKKDLNIFIDVYNKEIINESFSQTLKNVGNSLLRKATFGLAGKTKNQSLTKNLQKALEECGFEIGDNDNDEENFSEASIVLWNNKKYENKKYYKIIISNNYTDENDLLSYGIRCQNVISGKKVKIPSQNFKLKPSYNSNEIINVINKCISPLRVKPGIENKKDEALKYKQDLENVKKQVENAKNQEKQEENNKKELIQKISKIKENTEKIKDFLTNNKGKHKNIDAENKAFNLINELDDLFDDKSTNYKEIKLKYRELESEYRNIIGSLNSSNDNIKQKRK